MKHRTVNLRMSELIDNERKFQERIPYANGSRKYHVMKKREDDHVKELIEVIQRNPEDDLDNLKVWKDPDSLGWYLVDGFHRLKAYRDSGRRANKKLTCDVVEARNEHEVRLLVFKQNSKSQLGFTQRERLEAVWREVIRREAEEVKYSNRQLAEDYKVGRSSVNRMVTRAHQIFSKLDGDRKRHPRIDCWHEQPKDFLDDDYEEPPEMTEEDYEQMIEKQQISKLTIKIMELLESHGAERKMYALDEAQSRIREIELDKIHGGAVIGSVPDFLQTSDDF